MNEIDAVFLSFERRIAKIVNRSLSGFMKSINDFIGTISDVSVQNASDLEESLKYEVNKLKNVFIETQFPHYQTNTEDALGRDDGSFYSGTKTETNVLIHPSSDHKINGKKNIKRNMKEENISDDSARRAQAFFTIFAS